MTRVVLPSNGQLAVWTVSTTGLAVERPFPVTSADAWCWCERREHLAVVDQDCKRVSVWRIGPEGWERLVAPSTVPRRRRLRCTALKDSQLYFADDTLWVLEPSGAWGRIAVGGLEDVEDKQIDGLFVRGNRLTAVDDFALPKWNLAFDITVPECPRIVGARSLEAHTTYEHVTDVAAGERWFATSSWGINHGTTECFVALYECESLSPVGSISGSEDNGFKGICFSSDVLWILRGNGDVECINMSRMPPTGLAPPGLPPLLEIPDDEPQPERRVSIPSPTRIPVPESGKVTRLEPLMDGRCAAVFEDPGMGYAVLSEFLR